MRIKRTGVRQADNGLCLLPRNCTFDRNQTYCPESAVCLATKSSTEIRPIARKVLSASQLTESSTEIRPIARKVLSASQLTESSTEIRPIARKVLSATQLTESSTEIRPVARKVLSASQLTESSTEIRPIARKVLSASQLTESSTEIRPIARHRQPTVDRMNCTKGGFWPVYQVLLLMALVMVGPGLCWKCPVHEKVCDVLLELEHKVTMTKGKSLMVIKDHKLYPYDTSNFTLSYTVPVDEIITADGWAEPRVVIAVNGTLPGPLIEVHEQQIVRVHVLNKLMSESTSLHFHGQLQKGTPWMDGVSFVTQCPILPGQSFVHQFKAEPAGTYWYHAHTGGQTAMGVNGGFIVHPRQGASTRYDRQFTLLLQDWNHDWDSTMGFMKMQHGMYVGGKREDFARNLSGAKYSPFRCQAALINGRGRHRHSQTGQHSEAPVEIFDVRPGEIYRFRLINSGSAYPFRVSVDDHQLLIVATDGMELKDPVPAQSVILSPGERYDFELRTSQTVDNYWIRAQTLEVVAPGVDHYCDSEAILRYEGAPETQPISHPTQCTQESPCLVVNCPFSYYPAEDNTTCFNVEKLRSAQAIPFEIGAGATKIKEYFVNFAFPGTTWTPASVNGVQMRLPEVSALTQPQEVGSKCPHGYRCTEDAVCSCTPVLDLEGGEVVQIVMTNLGKGKGWDHPNHMHGHSFWVLKVGYPHFDNTTGKNVGDNMDIDCRGNPDRTKSYCNNATWADPSWSGNNVPGLELANPVLKDTVNVPTGGYVVIRFKADNPGLWAFHCHMSLHLEDGMFLLLNESFPNVPPPPTGFPRCGSFSLPTPPSSHFVQDIVG